MAPHAGETMEVTRGMGNVRMLASPTRGESGFSLVEMMVVTGVAVLLLSIGVPGFRTLIENQKLTTTVNDFFSAINLVRSEAIQRGARVDMMPLDGGSDWTKGWIVFADNNDTRKPDIGDEIIFTHGPAAGGLAIEDNIKGSEVKYLAYNGTGRTQSNESGQAPRFGSFFFSRDGKVMRKIKINFLGRASICTPAANNDSC
jgi:type IV fimbrial biogenesis protein FimT